MNKEEPFRTQAERLKQRIEKINEETSEGRDKLPPREQIHREKRKKTKLKVKYPIIRILVLFFILLPIVIFSAYSYLEEGKSNKTEKVTGDSSGYEVINFEKSETESSSVNKVVEEEDKSTVEIEEDTIEVQLPVSPETPVQDPVSEQGNNNIPNTDKNSSVSTETTITHTVKTGENLYRISLKYYHSKAGEEIIRKANKLKGNEIYVGQVLKIPVKK
ncbi:LysM peptidoglycan-binding domain-containing protein [Neobacillus sp. YX16]|uniref:LysM peptidoglycan-binding domain-containing protein n=1 Tax=Neobacillus sp. YX16 TaxID=3047874 RepID=UPI0024C2788B|nr:LysM peptidoglycan-binding domain-containing protein [Neobacillus sp. YX16]WHZ01575.1 LysM peptidoglycan-binding domain-containing protein [Neobacillus sp. YX16]